MECELCSGDGRVIRLRGGVRAGMVTCPRCVRGLTILHEAVQGRDRAWNPGESPAFITASTPFGGKDAGLRIREELLNS